MPLTSDFLGHAGLTVAAALSMEQILRCFFASSTHRGKQAAEPAYPNGSEKSESEVANKRKWNIDFRLVILGALLPDIIDRPLGLWFLPEFFDPSGRVFAHTLLFATLLAVFSLIMLRYTISAAPLVFSLSSAGHLLIDMMWESPKTLLWPLYGITFGHAGNNVSPYWLQWVHTVGGQILIDGLGALVLLFFAARLYRRQTVLRWLRTGVG